MTATTATRKVLARHFINGEFVDGARGQVFDTLNPATNQVIGQVAEGTADDIDAAVQAARRAFDSGPWRTMKAADRAKALISLAHPDFREGLERQAHQHGLLRAS